MAKDRGLTTAPTLMRIKLMKLIFAFHQIPQLPAARRAPEFML
jgi:hypothetical protein